MAGPTPTPAETDVTLGEHQFKFAGGPVMGEGTIFDLLSIDGLDTPRARVVQQSRDGEHGSYIYAKFAEHRTIAIELLLIVPPGEKHQNYLREISREFMLRTQPEPLFLRLDDEDLRIIYCLPVEFDYTLRPDTYNPGAIPCIAILQCPEPRVFSRMRTNTSLPQAIIGGRKYPKVFPVVYTTQGTAGVAVIVNEGSVLTWPRFKVGGPALNPKITHAETGRHFQLNVDLEAADTIIIDNDLKTVKLNGQDAMKLKTDISDWLFLEPGDNTFQYTSVSGEFTIEYRSADMIA